MTTPLAQVNKFTFGKFSEGNLQPVDISPLFFRTIGIVRNRRKPKRIQGARWEAIVQHLDVLVRDERHHLLKMAEYNWRLEELFGCHKFNPDTRTNSMGLLMQLPHTDSTIAEIRPRKALLRSKQGSMISYCLGTINRNPCECSALVEIE